MATPIVETWTLWRQINSPFGVDEDYPVTQNVSGFESIVKPIKVIPSQAELGVLDVLIAFFDANGDLKTNDDGAKLTLQVVEVVEIPEDSTPGGLSPNTFLAAIGDEVEFEIKDGALSGMGRRGSIQRFSGAVGFSSRYGIIVAKESVPPPTFDKMGIFARFA